MCNMYQDYLPREEGTVGNKQSPSCCICGLIGNFKSCGQIKNNNNDALRET